MLSHPDHEPGDGPDAAAETPARKLPPRGVDPLSLAHRRRVLKALAKTAEGTDALAIQAQAALIELSMSAERDAKIAEALEQLRGGDDKGIA